MVKEFLAQNSQDKYDVGLKDANLQIPKETINRCIDTFTDRVCDELAAYLKTCRAELKKDDIPVLLVGGSSRLPDLEEKIKRIAGASPVHRWEKSDYAIVLGATLKDNTSPKTAGSEVDEQDTKVRIVGGTVVQASSLDEKQSAKQTAKTPAENFEIAVRYMDTGNDTEAARYFRMAAEQGEVVAMFNLGVFYATGKGVQKNDTEALRWYQKAAEQGNADAQYNLGTFYRDGIGVRQSDKIAFEWFDKAAHQGDADALREVGICYEEGKGVKQDYIKAFKSMSLAVEAGDEYAKILLGEYYRCGIGVPRNDQKAFELYREMAEQGDDYGQLQVAMYYLRGSGIAKNGAEALMWFYKAAQNGNKEAQSKMDSFCANEISLEIGLGNPKRTEEIESLNNFRKDAEQGDVDTQFLLGLLLLHDVTCKDEDVKWFRRAAENGHAEAQYYMGTFFEHGYKVRPSESLAMEWFRKAAENGHSIAQHNLGFYYEVRMGNDKEAAKWYLMAARQGNIDAMAQALAYHEDGIVPLQMDDETKKWVSKVRKMM